MQQCGQEERRSSDNGWPVLWQVPLSAGQASQEPASLLGTCRLMILTTGDAQQALGTILTL